MCNLFWYFSSFKKFCPRDLREVIRVRKMLFSFIRLPKFHVNTALFSSLNGAIKVL